MGMCVRRGRVRVRRRQLFECHVTLLRVLLRVDLLLGLLRFGVHLVPVALEVDARVVRHL